MRRLYCILLLLSVTMLGCSVHVKVKIPKDVIADFKDTVLPSIVIHMDTAFTEEERKDADYAALVWKTQTSGLADIQLVYDVDFGSVSKLNSLIDSHANIVIRYESGMIAVDSADAAAGCDGCVLGWMTSGGIHNPAGDPVMGGFVADRISRIGVRTHVMIHEFGHSLGLPHVGARQALMYPSVDPRRTTCLKKPDLVAFCDVNECGNHKMIPCE